MTDGRLPIKLAVFTKNRSNPAYDGARHAADLIGARHGAAVRHYVPETPDDPQQQSGLIDQALAWQPDAILLAPVHPQLVLPAIRRIEAAGVPIFGIVNQLPDVRYAGFVGSDDTALGTALAAHLFGVMKGVGSVAVIEGPSHSTTSNDRVDAFLAQAKQHPGIRIVARIAGEYQLADARTAFARYLESSPCPDAVLSANDIMAIGVLDAIDMRPLPQPAPLVAGINAIPQAIDAIAAGRMLATADFNPMQMAATAAECAIAYLRGEPFPAAIELPVRIIGAAAARAWPRAWENRPLSSLKELTK